MSDSVVIILDGDYAEGLFDLCCKMCGLDDEKEIFTLEEYDIISDLRMTLSQKLVIDVN